MQSHIVNTSICDPAGRETLLYVLGTCMAAGMDIYADLFADELPSSIAELDWQSYGDSARRIVRVPAKRTTKVPLLVFHKALIEFACVRAEYLRFRIYGVNTAPLADWDADLLWKPYIDVEELGEALMLIRPINDASSVVIAWADALFEVAPVLRKHPWLSPGTTLGEPAPN
jgi:hypothetical protein